FEIMSQLMRAPMRSFKGVAVEEVRNFDLLDYKSFNTLQDSHIIDLRPWDPTGAEKTDTASLVYGYRRLKVQKIENHGNLESTFKLTQFPISAAALSAQAAANVC